MPKPIAAQAGTLAETRRRQSEAADPTASVWVSANAGTGKTYVLTMRVLRLLLAGTSPERILALTYTKAAAAEMSKRVFDQLGGWATAPEPVLAGKLRDLLGCEPDPEQTTRARHLFAAAIETPGGLKVQTIHAFCERLLQRFPLEAGIPPHFTILDEAATADLRRQATDAMLTAATRTPASALGQALRQVVAYAVDDSFDAILKDALGRRDWLAAMSRLGSDGVATLYRKAFDLGAGETMATAEAALSGVLANADLEGLRDILRGGSTNDLKAADRMDAASKSRGVESRIAALAAVFLTGEGKPRVSLITKGLVKSHPDAESRLVRAQERFVAAHTAWLKLRLLAATEALIVLADDVMARYGAAKARRAALDFDDLIRRASSLLGMSAAPGAASAAEWVLYKLDGGLDHILVDEAQDTSPAQWAVVEALAKEFFAGAGARDLVRTLFAVGDEKQSIYGFQGAAPEMFARMGRHFSKQARESGQMLVPVPLDLSFRTVAPVLAAVDAVFADAKQTPGVSDLSGPVQHAAHRSGQAGLVEIWPLEVPADTPETEAWSPLDEAPASSPVAQLATRITDTIAGWLATGEMLKSENRPIKPGDILILVRRRRPFAPAMVAALKARKIPVAGADRLRLGEQIAVQDLLALGEFLVLPEDDLALASVLKSPLFDLDDDHLMAIAPGRKGSLWSALLARAKTDPRFAEAAGQLKQWRAESDFMPPYEFLASLLERNAGRYRRRMLARLGPESADAIDELLNLALTFDDANPPSLQGFLSWLSASEREIKRDMEQGRDEVRVMTVHGAKGLEAPIVFMPDTCATGSGARPGSLLAMAGIALPAALAELMIWPAKGTSETAVVRTAREALAHAEFCERNRLLYVALTRPRDRLYIAGFRGSREPAPHSWYKIADAALASRLTEVTLADGRIVRRFESGQDAPHEKPRAEVFAAADPRPLPEWAGRPAPREPQLSIPLAPSRLAPLETDDEGDPLDAPPRRSADPPVLPPGVMADQSRFLRGTLTHALLEHLPGLPAATWPLAAARFLAERGAMLGARARESIATEALAVLGDPAFADLFGPQSQAEVAIVAEIARPHGKGPPLRLTGQIDRLVRVGDAVTIVDYKTNRPPPRDADGVAETYLLQLAAYRLAVGRIYPGCRVRAAILWTDGARIMEIPPAMLAAAEQRLWQRG